MKERGKRIPASTVRPLSDREWWDRVSGPLLVFLDRPRSREELTLWRGEHKMREGTLVNALAYLSVEGRVGFDFVSKRWGPPALARRPPTEVDEATTRSDGKRRAKRTRPAESS